MYLVFHVIARAGMAWGQVTRWLHLSIAGRHILGTCDCPIYYPFHGLQLSKAYTQLCPKRDHVSSEARCLHQALHLSTCRKLLRHDWHLQDACRSLPQQLSLHGGWHTYACVEIFLVDLRDFQLLGTHHLEIPSSANSIIDFQHILQTSFLAKICCVHQYMNFPP